ncbi:MAG: PorP/SprF family type IX secretion system membrane protein, partial [Saprospiraceae bacterium]|nr:PorP/SprF family type IX secretion system membrane protein [Saprospiraceae bacterium]
MKFKTLLSSFILLLMGLVQTNAQDLHFTLWDMNPLNINPAFAGSFSGTFRVTGIYRDQWRSAVSNSNLGNPYTTPSFGIDAPIIQGFRKNDWVGVGVGMFSDKAGSLEMGYSGFSGGAAYHLGLNKASTSVLTLGIQYQSISRNVNFRNAQWGDNNLAEYTTNDMLQQSFSDWSGGLLLKTQLSEQMDM